MIPEEPPPPGSFVVDARTERVGRGVAADGHRLRLAPIGGGREWHCASGTARPATVTERLSAATAFMNAHSRGEVV
ncbi:hypothetical protein [Streptomyces sp. NPDC093589]|uniref:hypothetical protein n=1 Tax=Streptomyces sp. NPDC093589 TaxID=3366043 RepID=UPI0038079708